MQSGGRLVVLGDLGANLSEETRLALLEYAITTWNPDPDGFDPSLLPFGLQARLSTEADLAINVQRVARGAAVHLIHYDYDKEQDRLPAMYPSTVYFSCIRVEQGLVSDQHVRNSTGK